MKKISFRNLRVWDSEIAGDGAQKRIVGDIVALDGKKLALVTEVTGYVHLHEIELEDYPLAITILADRFLRRHTTIGELRQAIKAVKGE